MRLDKICRTCLAEKASMKSLFDACIPNMIMSCTSIQVIQGDGLPTQICTQCLQIVNRSFTFKQQCERSDSTLRNYITNINLDSITLTNAHNLICTERNDILFENSEVLQQSALFNEIFGGDTTHSLVDTFTTQAAEAVVSDLADTMESLQTIAEQCLPESWENETTLIDAQVAVQEPRCQDFNLEPFLKCHFCEELYGDEWSLAEHIMVHTGHAKYYCIICGQGYGTSLALTRHVNSHALISSNEIETEHIDQTKQVYRCSLCEKLFDDENLFRKHLKDDHTDKNIEKKYVCTICGKRYSQNKFLVLHIRSHTGEKPLHCELCGKCFSLPSSLLKHRLVHTQQRRFNCTICGKAFKQISHLTVHLRSHTGEKPYVCSICGKGCTTNINLELHMRLHTGHKPYQCSQCDRSFTTSGQLKRHFLTHTGEKPYKCWQCGKAFRKKETRDTHVRYHTGERPYACRLCPKRYIAPSHLRVHMKGHTGEKKYQCSVCPKAFVEARTLKSHLATHSRVKMYPCKYCGQTFQQSTILKAHVKGCHK